MVHLSVARNRLSLGSGVVIAKIPFNPSFNSHAEVVWSRVPRSEDEESSRGMGVRFIE